MTKIDIGIRLPPKSSRIWDSLQLSRIRSAGPGIGGAPELRTTQEVQLFHWKRPQDLQVDDRFPLLGEIPKDEKGSTVLLSTPLDSGIHRNQGRCPNSHRSRGEGPRAPERSEKDDVINSIARPGLESPRPSKTHARKTPTFSFLLLATGSGIQLPRHQIGRKLAVPALEHSLEVFEGFLDRGLE